MNESQKHILIKDARHKGYIIYDIIYKKYKNRQNLFVVTYKGRCWMMDQEGEGKGEDWQKVWWWRYSVSWSMNVHFVVVVN